THAGAEVVGDLVFEVKAQLGVKPVFELFPLPKPLPPIHITFLEWLRGRPAGSSLFPIGIDTEPHAERLFLCRIKRDKAACLPGIAPTGVTRNDWIRINRESELRSPLCQSPGDQYSGRLSLFYPVFERRERVEIRQPRPARAMVDAGNQEQPEEVLGLLPAAHPLHYALVVADGGGCHDAAVGQAVPHQDLAASILKGV